VKDNPVLRRIIIYPVKALDGMSLEKAQISEGGCILHDREFAMSDSNGNFINGKSNPRVHTLRSKVDFEKGMLSLRDQADNSWNHFQIEVEKTRIQEFLSDYFSMPVILLQNKTGRFLDSPDRGGVTVLSTSSLHSVSGWFPGLSLAETRTRFRATFEIDGVEPFWEDRLFSSTPGTMVAFKIGDVMIHGTSPCARCVVPSRNPETSTTIQGFQKTFSEQRSSSLSARTALGEYGHFYFMSVNCYIPPTEVGKWINTGDPISVIG
jgi:uncharacterized protein YcbX